MISSYQDLFTAKINSLFCTIAKRGWLTGSKGYIKVSSIKAKQYSPEKREVRQKSHRSLNQEKEQHITTDSFVPLIGQSPSWAGHRPSLAKTR